MNKNTKTMYILVTNNINKMPDFNPLKVKLQFSIQLPTL
jgi:hypothetical protein